MIQLQGEDTEAADRMVQQVQSPLRGSVVLSSSSESPEIIGVSASYDEDLAPRGLHGDMAISSSRSQDDSLAVTSPAKRPSRGAEAAAEEMVHGGRRRSVKEIIDQIHSSDPDARAAGLAELESRGAIALPGLSFESLPDSSSGGLRVQSGQFMNEVVGRLSEKPVMDDDSRAESMESSLGEGSTLDDDAKMYQERLNNRNNNVLVKRDAASFRMKKESIRSAGSDRPVVSKAAAARLHTMKAKNAQLKNGGTAATLDPINTNYTFDELKNRTVEELSTNPYPRDVDVENREQYLKDDEFFQVFGLTKADFNGIAKWRKTEMKKKKNLY